MLCKKTSGNIAAPVAAIVRKMNEQLERITPANRLQKMQLCFQIARQGATALKELADSHDFQSLEGEINFYKTTYADVLESVYYYAMKYEFEAHAPYKDAGQKVRYIRRCLTGYRFDLEKLSSFYNYVHLGETHLDVQYFTGTSDMPMPPDAAIGLSGYQRPADYYCGKFARVQALMRLINELQSELHALNEAHRDGVRQSDQGLTWTGSKVELIELTYALFEHGSINKGDVTLKRIIHAFEHLFNIDLDNYLTLFKQSIRMRKDTRTIFLEALTRDLTQRMDSFDEKKTRG